MLSSSASLAARLDLADEVRATLTACGASGDGSSLADVFNDIPQFVVVGAQSSGKSSVLSRISGIEFPTGSERCTRVATLLKLRRAPAESTPSVWLRGKAADGATVHEGFGVEEGQSTADAIRSAQDRAVELADASEGFVETLEIEIAVAGPHLPNVTLVDLPGLIAPRPGSTAPETVDRIVTRFANMAGSLVLNVVPLEQDYDTGLGKGIVEPLLAKTTFVFTKLDVLFKLGPEVATRRLQHVMRETRGAARVVALGQLAADVSEEKQLAEYQPVLGAFDAEELGRGKATLCSLIEDRMQDHLESRMPVLEAAVRKERDARKKRVEQLKPRLPMQDMVLASKQVRAALENRASARTDFFRGIREEMQTELKKAGTPAEAATVYTCAETGKRLYYVASHREWWVNNKVNCTAGKRGGYLNVQSNNSTHPPSSSSMKKWEVWTPKLAAKDKWLATEQVQVKVEGPVVRISHDPKLESSIGPECSMAISGTFVSAASRVTELVGTKLGLRNVAFADPQPVLEHFAGELADEVGAVVAKANDKAAAFVREEARHAVMGTRTDGRPVLASKALGALMGVLDTELDRLVREAKRNKDRVVAYNRPPLVFTTNEHYLEDIFKELVKSSEPPTKDGISAELIYLRWLAYRKVQVKVLVETATKDLVRTFLVGFEDAVEKLTESFFDPKYVGMILPEPAPLRRERARLGMEIAKLDEVIAAFESEP